jgi:hypothetical protein
VIDVDSGQGDRGPRASVIDVDAARVIELDAPV